MKKENIELKKKTDEIVMIHQSKLIPFAEQPYKVLIDESMEELAENIRENGVLSPITVRKINDGQYEIISGHRRVTAAKLQGFINFRQS